MIERRAVWAMGSRGWSMLLALSVLWDGSFLFKARVSRLLVTALLPVSTLAPGPCDACRERPHPWILNSLARGTAP